MLARSFLAALAATLIAVTPAAHAMPAWQEESPTAVEEGIAPAEGGEVAPPGEADAPAPGDEEQPSGGDAAAPPEAESPEAQIAAAGMEVRERFDGDVTGDGVPEVLYLAVGAGCVSCHYQQLWVFQDSQLLTLVETDDARVALLADGNGFELTQPLRQEDEPMCCPSSLVTRTFVWNGAEFDETISDPFPTPE